ncbi:hypothetical protein ES703_106008 [subsurface metagenome]
MEHGGGIVQITFLLAHRAGDDPAVLHFPSQGFQGFLQVPQEGFLEQQVLGRVAGQGALGEYHHLVLP